MKFDLTEKQLNSLFNNLRKDIKEESSLNNDYLMCLIASREVLENYLSFVMDQTGLDLEEVCGPE